MNMNTGPLKRKFNVVGNPDLESQAQISRTDDSGFVNMFNEAAPMELDTIDVFVTPQIAVPQTTLDLKIQSGDKDAYSLLTPQNQIARNKEICQQIRDAISKTFTIPTYTNDTSLFDSILDSIPHNDMQSITDFYKTVDTCLNPDYYYKTDLAQLGNNDDSKKLFIETFRTYVQSLITPGQQRSAFNPNDESQMDPLPFKHSDIITEAKTTGTFHPGSSLIYKGTEINYGMSSLFTTRIKSFFGGDVPFNTLVNSILTLFSNVQTGEFKPQLVEAYDKEKLLYNLTKFYIDAGDLIHDINKRRTDNLNNNNYYTGLITIGTKLKGQNVSIELDKCFTSSVVNNIKTVSQEKTRKMRNDALALILQTNPTVSTLIPKQETIALTQETGYFELINQISIIYGSSPIGKFVYRESGRELQITGIINYFNVLSDDSKTTFIQKCVDYCDNKDVVTIDYVKQIISNENPPKLQVDLKSITSFDGCGTTKGISRDTINVAVFENVFGFFKYVVYTVFDKRENEFNHLVIANSYTEPLQFAIFGFVGNITINMLLGVEQIPTTRDGLGEKGDIKPIKSIILILKALGWIEPTLITQVEIDDESSVYYNNSITLDSGVRQLLFLGNKTIGDLIVTTYDDVKTITTVDSLIADSTMYNFLAGTSDVLQSVWRQTGSKGWVFTPGMFKADLTTKSNYIAIQLIGSLMLLQVALTPGLSNDLNPVPQPLVKTYGDIINKICSNCITNLKILSRFRVLLNYTFVDFSNHITNLYVDTPSIYNECMLQLLIIENKVIQNRVKNYINTLATYITNYNNSTSNVDADNITFLNHIYLLPKLETLFFSNMSNIASNNQEAYDLPGLIDKKIVPVNKITISTINTKSIIFSYNSESKFTDQSYFKKNLITPQEITLADPLKIPGADRRDPTRTYTFTIPYTMESLINLFETDKLDDTTKLDVANRIVMFFKNNINTIGINDVSTDSSVIAALESLTTTLTKAGIMTPNKTLSSYESTFVEEDSTECGLECDPLGCSINDDNPNNNWNIDSQQVDQPTMETGGKQKTTRKKRKTKQKRKTKRGNKKVLNKTKKMRKHKKNTKTRKRK